MRVRLLVSLSIALLATVLVIAAGLAQTTTPAVVTHNSVPITLLIAAPGTGQPITVTLVLDVEASPGATTGDPAVKIKVTTKRFSAAEGATVSGVTIGDIASANSVATPAAVPGLGGLLPTPTPAPQLTSTLTSTASLTATATSTVNDAANLRQGPGTTFAIAGRAQAGAPITITGRNATSDWLQLPDGTWIAAFLVDDAPGVLPMIETTVPVTTAP
jgi:hypothetical protein